MHIHALTGTAAYEQLRRFLPEGLLPSLDTVRRNVVISSGVLDGPRSLVVQQAGNRLWAQAALVEHLARRAGVL